MKYYRIKIAGQTWVSKDPYGNYDKWQKFVKEMFENTFNEKAEVEEINKEDFEKEKN